MKKVLVSYIFGRKVSLTTLLFWQQTGVAEQPPCPRPMTVMGEQSRPTSASRGETTIPSRPRSTPTSPPELA